MAENLKPLPVNRQFYSIPKGSRFADDINETNDTQSDLNASDLLEEPRIKQEKSLLQYVSENVIGANKTFSGPFGLRKVTYLDYVASGRALEFLEEYIHSEVLPEYGNTHTTTSTTSLQTTLFRHEARDILRNSFNASEHDSVIFTASGCTGAVHKLIKALNIEKNNTVVLVGPYEHHSNILPWKEAGAEVIRIQNTATGHVDLNHLTEVLVSFKTSSKQLIGSFSAASNVTGVLSNVDAITICLHKHGALAVWDYACAAPYVKLDMNPYTGGPDQPYVYKDAVVLSMHKFVGGTSTPGVLIAKKKLFRNPVPEGCGGGTVFFVRRDNYRYLQEPESREEGGTPAIVQSIRAGLVVQLKQAIGVDTIVERDKWLLSEAEATWADIPELIMLGPRPGSDAPEKLPIFSFLVLHPATGRFLHHNFVAAVLNDVFGIQARGGCACAGPYAMDLLGLDETTAAAIEELIAEDSRLDRTHLRRVREYSHREILRPGFVRLNLPYFMEEDCLNFVLEAVKMTAQHAWKLLPQYLFNPETAEWRQRHFQTFKDRKWLGHISYQSGQMKYHQPKQVVKGPLPTSYQDCLVKAKQVFDEALKLRVKVPDQTALFDEEAEPFRWFVLPSEASACLLKQGNSSSLPLPAAVDAHHLPFFPGRPVVTQLSSGLDAEHKSNKSEPEICSSVINGDSSDRSQQNEINQIQGRTDVSNNITQNGLPVPNKTSQRKGGMIALEDALKYADEILHTTGSNQASREVSTTMNGLWDKFDTRSTSAQKHDDKKMSAVQEVSNTMNNIWASFGASKDSTVTTTSSVGMDASASTGLASETKNTLTDEEKKENSPKVDFGVQNDNGSNQDKVSNVDQNKPMNQIHSAMKNIWESFTPGKSFTKPEPNGDVWSKISESSTHKKDDHEQVQSNFTAAEYNHPHPSQHATCANKNIDYVTPGKFSSNTVEDVRRAMEAIWGRFTPRKEDLSKQETRVSETIECQSKSIGSEVLGKVSLQLAESRVRVVNGHGISPTIESANTHKALGEIKDVMNSIWDHFSGIDTKTNEADKSANLKDDQKLTKYNGISVNGSGDTIQSFAERMVNSLSKGFVEKMDDEIDTVPPVSGTSSVIESISITNPSQPDVVNEGEKENSLAFQTQKTPTVQMSTVKTNQSQSTSSKSNNNPYSKSDDQLHSNKMSNIASSAAACPYIKGKKTGSAQGTVQGPDVESCKVQWFAPPKQIFKPAVTALEEYSMLKDGDKVLVCLSGGKDSLSLLHTIRQYQFYARGKGINFEFGAVTVDPMTPAYDPSPLKQYLASLGVPYFYESQCILDTAEQLPYECASICSFCSRMKRGRIYAAARREGYNVLALGQHLDDLTESFLMSFFHNGNLNTMKAHYTVKTGDLRVIRPFVYVREADLRAFAEQRKLPIIAENCPACFEAPKERHRTKQLLAAQEVMFPQVYSSMMAALKPLMARDLGDKVTQNDNDDD